MKSRAARVSVFGSHGDSLASSIANSKKPASCVGMVIESARGLSVAESLSTLAHGGQRPHAPLAIGPADERSYCEQVQQLLVTSCRQERRQANRRPLKVRTCPPIPPSRSQRLDQM